MQPQIWRCKNQECTNLVSDVNQKTIPKEYCSVECREYVNRKKLNEKYKVCTCEYCTRVFRSKKRGTRFCSPLCAVRKARGVKLHSKCEECDKPISIFGRKRFCSKRCKKLSYFKRKVGELSNV
jgi:hypothetical protein